LFYFLFKEDEIMAQLRNNPAVKVNVDDYRDMMFVFAVAIAPADVDIEHCLHCGLELGVCECIPAEAAILNDDFDGYTVIDAEFEKIA
jgi:hypothetical protein